MGNIRKDQFHRFRIVPIESVAELESLNQEQ